MKSRKWAQSPTERGPGKTYTRTLWDGCGSFTEVSGQQFFCVIGKRHTDFHASALESTCDFTCTHRTANCHCAGSRINLNGSEISQVKIDSCQHSTQGCRIAMATAGGEEGDVVGQCISDLGLYFSFRTCILVSPN